MSRIHRRNARHGRRRATRLHGRNLTTITELGTGVIQVGGRTVFSFKKVLIKAIEDELEAFRGARPTVVRVDVELDAMGFQDWRALLSTSDPCRHGETIRP